MYQELYDLYRKIYFDFGRPVEKSAFGTVLPKLIWIAYSRGRQGGHELPPQDFNSALFLRRPYHPPPPPPPPPPPENPPPPPPELIPGAELAAAIALEKDPPKEEAKAAAPKGWRPLYQPGE